MRVTINDETCTITCTCGELIRMESLGMGIYATPTPQGDANQLYISARPNFKYDFLIATLEDFLAEEGIDTLGWQDMDQEETLALETNTPPTTIIVSRRKQRTE